ncbi:glycyl-tRNA synthetase [Pancytospora philotis]|nr:glycyl-tRNA synthetase [Pancytospora philotis]
MDSKAKVEAILKQRFFVTPTAYPLQNGFLDYGPPLAQIKLQVLAEFRRVFVDEITYEMEPSAVVPYEVLKNSGHIDKFCDVVLSDGANTVRADHFIEEKVGDAVVLPVDLATNYAALLEAVETAKKEAIIERNSRLIKQKKLEDVAVGAARLDIAAGASTEQLSADEVARILSAHQCETRSVSDLTKLEIDFVVRLHNLHSQDARPFNPSRDFNLVFKLNEQQFLRPEIAQSQFTNFRKIFDLNNERLPFSSLAIGRSYRNEISARGGMYRTKEFEQAEIEYFSESGRHSGFESVRGVEVVLYPNSQSAAYATTIGAAFDAGVITSEAICYFVAKAQEFFLCLGIAPATLRFRQHNPNEMAHYANDCWDAEIRTMAGWIECAGIADRGTFDLTCHAKNINTAVRRDISPRTVYVPQINKKELGQALQSRLKALEDMLAGLSEAYIQEHMRDEKLTVRFDDKDYTFELKKKTVNCEFFTPRVIEPSFGVSRILYALLEQGFNVRDERNVLSLRPKLCFLHCMITWLKYLDEFAPLVAELKRGFKARGIRFQTNERSCSIGKKYSSCDEIGIPYFITFDFDTPKDNTVTVRDRDSMEQIRIPVALVGETVSKLISEESSWTELRRKYALHTE